MRKDRARQRQARGQKQVEEEEPRKDRSFGPKKGEVFKGVLLSQEEGRKEGEGEGKEKWDFAGEGGREAGRLQDAGRPRRQGGGMREECMGGRRQQPKKSEGMW